MRISDWSSDVCSSDLGGGGAAAFRARSALLPRRMEPVRFRHHRPDAGAGDRQSQCAPDIPYPPRAPDHLGGTQAEGGGRGDRSEEHTSELQSLMRISYAVFCLKKKNKKITENKR